MSSPDFKATLIAQEKIAHFEVGNLKQVLDEYSSSLKFSLKTHAYFYFGHLILYLVLSLRIHEKI